MTFQGQFYYDHHYGLTPARWPNQSTPAPADTTMKTEAPAPPIKPHLQKAADHINKAIIAMMEAEYTNADTAFNYAELALRQLREDIQVIEE